MDATPENARQQRLFFALWPDEQLVKKLVDLQQSLPVVGRPVAASNFHITLAFIGEADPAYADCLQRAAAAVEFQPFTLLLDHLGYFRRSRILWVGPSSLPAALNVLHQHLQRHLEACGFEPEAGVFTPHVTLARNSRTLAHHHLEPLAWHIDSFALVESHVTSDGASYRVLQEYPARDA